MDKDEVPAKASSLVEVKVAPKKNPSRWNGFFKWFRKIEKTPEVQYTKEKVKEYLEAKIDCGVEAARNPGMANLKSQAEIEKIVREFQIAEDENRRKNSLFELELQALELENQEKKAQIKKINAEARKLETDTDMKLLEELEKRGFKTLIDIGSDGTPRLVTIDERKGSKKLEEDVLAEAGVKSLEEYTKQAKLPEVFGFSGRVVDVICQRIGKQPLVIDFVAEDLNVNKKILQGRLKDQNINYEQLRDQVRFHFSIKYLVNKTMSIDGISSALDFNERSNFTNAFKRWTGLSPSTFRKIFRDYAE